MTDKLTGEQIDILRQYEHTHEGHFMQGIKGASSLPKGLLEWHGTQYGTSFYSITQAGRELIAKDKIK
jgi:hypothetical protein